MEEQSLENIVKHRCIQVVDEPSIEYTDYHTLSEMNDQVELTGQAMVDSIIERRFFPNGRWS